MEKARLMVIMEDRAWTLAALHVACAISRHDGASVLLLKMVRVRHPLLLGTEAGWVNLSHNDALALHDMSATAEDYDVLLEVQLYQYASYWSGVTDAAAQLGVTAVIARIPPSPIPYWQAFRRGWLHRRLACQQQLFLPLDELKPSLVWTPSTTLQNDLARRLAQRQS